MKNIKKLLLPVASIAASAAIVTPLVTSCGQMTNFVANTEITKDYKPVMSKHEEVEDMNPETAISDYIKAIKKDANIITEDYKYSAGQVYSLIDEMLEEIPEEEKYNIDVKLTSFKAGLDSLSFNDDNQYSYRNGMTVTVEAKIDLSDYMPYIIGYEYPCHIYVKADNLGYETKFNNFDTFDVSQETSLLDYGFTEVKPVFPSDLTNEDWSLNFKAFGGLYVTLNEEPIITIDDVNLDYTFDADNTAALFLDMGFSSSSFYLIDLLQSLGSFASYYMSDVTCATRVTEKDDGIVDVEKETQGNTWWGYFAYSNPRRYDPETLVTLPSPRLFDSSQGPVSGPWSTSPTDFTTLYAFVRLDPTSTYWSTYGWANEVRYGLAKYREDIPSSVSETGYGAYQWRETHKIYPRFNQDMEYNATYGLVSPLDSFYTNGSLCAFNIKYDGEHTIAQNDVFSIVTGTAEAPQYLKFLGLSVNITVTDYNAETEESTTKTLKADEDYKVANDGKSIGFLKAIDAPAEGLTRTVRIELQTLQALKEETDKAMGIIVAGE